MLLLIFILFYYNEGKSFPFIQCCITLLVIWQLLLLLLLELLVLLAIIILNIINKITINCCCFLMNSHSLKSELLLNFKVSRVQIFEMTSFNN